MLTWSLGWAPVAGEVGDHLVGVHVRGGAGAGLEDVDRELVVVLAGGDRVAGGGDPLGQVGVELAQLAVDPRRGGLQPAQPADDRHRHPLAGDREVVDRLGGLATPELLSQCRRLHRFRLWQRIEGISWAMASSQLAQPVVRRLRSLLGRRARKARGSGRLPGL